MRDGSLRLRGQLRGARRQGSMCLPGSLSNDLRSGLRIRWKDLQVSALFSPQVDLRWPIMQRATTNQILLLLPLTYLLVQQRVPTQCLQLQESGWYIQGTQWRMLVSAAH